MRIGLLLPSVFMSQQKYKNMIFAPRELFVHLADGLVDLGHSVHVFASGDTPTKAHIIKGDDRLASEGYIYQKLKGNQDEAKKKWGTYFIHKNFYELNLTQKAYQMGVEGKLDIIHSYHDYFAHFFDETTRFPTIYTLHDPLPREGTIEYWLAERFKNHQYISISNAQRQHSTLKLNFVDTVYHGLDVRKIPFQAKASDYLLFMGRLVPEKGLHLAIKVAIELNIQLEIGTQFPDATHENAYFVKQIKPFLDNPLIGEPGMVEGDNKDLLYKQARALLFPIEWEEPFGMVMVEAMACGTPVIAYNRGSVSEIVRDGVTGFIVNPPEADLQVQSSKFKVQSGEKWIIKKRGIEGLVEAVGRIGEIDRAACRKHVEDNFTVEKMVEGYERVYEKVIREGD